MRSVLSEKQRETTIACQRWIYYCNTNGFGDCAKAFALENFIDVFDAIPDHTSSGKGIFHIFTLSIGIAFLSVTVGKGMVIVTLQIDCGSHGEPRDKIDEFKLRLRDDFQSKSMKSDDDCWRIVDEDLE